MCVQRETEIKRVCVVRKRDNKRNCVCREIEYVSREKER